MRCRINADTNVRKHSFVKNNAGEIQHRHNQNDVDDIRQNMTLHDFERSQTEGTSRLNVIKLRNLQSFGTQQTSERGPACQTDDDRKHE